MVYDVKKIADYLSKYKNELDTIYTWDFKIGKDLLNSIDTTYKLKLMDLNESDKNTFRKNIELRKILSDALINYKEGSPEFEKISLWIIREWGGIKNTDSDTIDLVKDFLASEKPSFKRIASTSKVGSFKNPDKNIIYDSRVAYSMNWIILSQNAGDKYFPIPPGRNTKLCAFDLNVLIRLKNIASYQISQTRIKNKHISTTDCELFIPEKEAYYELNKLICDVNRVLWNDGEKPPYYTEMILFSIADIDVFKEITEKVNITIK